MKTNFTITAVVVNAGTRTTQTLSSEVDISRLPGFIPTDTSQERINSILANIFKAVPRPNAAQHP